MVAAARYSPSRVSTESCRPRLCRGLTTQWLLVAVMSKTSQPSSEAQRVRLSSRKRSDSLREEGTDTGSGLAGSPLSHPNSKLLNKEKRLVRWRRQDGASRSSESKFVRHKDPS